jgi:hypothetical protein
MLFEFKFETYMKAEIKLFLIHILNKSFEIVE